MLFFLVIASFSVSQISGWGGDGHAIITELASSLMSPRSARFMENFLGDDLIGPSRWADTDEALTSYPGSSSYHFSHTPYRDCKPFDIKRDCRNGSCIVTGLADAINTSIDPPVSREERVDALKFVLHLMADIHQPLHTGFREDSGGTLIALNQPANMSLHEVWDYGLIDRATSDWHSIVVDVSKSIQAKNGIFIQRIRNQTDIAKILSSEGNTTVLSNIRQYVATIASETVMTSTCNIAYKDENGNFLGRMGGDNLSDEYFRTRIQMMKIQFAKAAVRLARLIDAITAVYTERLGALRETAREARIAARLFTSVQNQTTRSREPLAENYFGVLALDFDLEAFVFDTDVVTDAKANVSKGTKSAKARRIAKRIEVEKKLRRDEKKRVARMIDGVDLSGLVLIRRDGKYYITDKQFVVSKTSKPLQTVFVNVKFTNQGESDDPILFLLDTRVFIKLPTAGLLAKIFRAIKGENEDVGNDESGTGSVSGVPGMMSAAEISKLEIAHSGSRELDPVSAALLPVISSETEEEYHADGFAKMVDRNAAYYAMFKSTKERLEYETRIDRDSVARLSKIEKELIALNFPGNVVISKLSIIRDSKNTFFEFNNFGAVGSHSNPFSLWIDRRVLDKPLTDGTIAFLQKTINSVAMARRAREVASRNEPLVLQLSQFFKAFGKTRAEMNMIQLLYYKTFTIQQHPDHPLMTTLIVDLTLDPSRAPAAKQISDLVTFLKR